MEFNSTKASQSESGNQISNYDEFKQVKKSGIQRRQKLLAMKQSGIQNSSVNQSQLLIDFQRENQQKEEILMNQQNNAKKKKVESQAESAYQMENAPVNFETIQQELLNISVNKSAVMTERKLRQGGQIVLDRQLMDQAKPMFQVHTNIDLDINDPQQLQRFQFPITQYREQKQDLIQLSQNISQKVKRNENSQSRINTYQNEYGNYLQNNRNSSIEQNESINTLQSPFENFFTKQEESMRTKAMNKFQQKNSNKQGEREEDINYYQDTQEDLKFQNADQKRRQDPLAKQFDFVKLNSPKKWQKQNLQNMKQKPRDKVDSLMDQFIYEENRGQLIDQIKEIPDFFKEEDQDIYLPKKNAVPGLLLPQMYQGNLLKLPYQLQKDHYETYLGGYTNYKNQQQKMQNEMIFNQISPLAREAFRNISQIEAQITNQPSSRSKMDNLVTPKVKNMNLLNDDPQFSPEEINFETILNIVGDGIPQEKLNQLVASQENVNVKEVQNNQNALDNSKEYETQGKSNTSQEIVNFKNMLHSQSHQHNNGNGNNNINNSISSKNNNTIYDQPTQDISTNYKQQSDRNIYEKDKEAKQVFDQSVQYEVNLSNDRITDAIIEKDITEFQLTNQKQQQIQQTPKVESVKQQNQPIIQNLQPIINQDIQMQKKQIEQILSDINQLQNQRNNPNISELEEERLINILKGRLTDLIEFVKYDNFGNDLFGDVTQQLFLESFPQNVEKIKGQTVGGFSKMLLLYKYFENFLPLIQHNSSQQQINEQNKSSPEVLMKHYDYSKANYNGANTARENMQNNRNENINGQYNKSPMRNGNNQGVTFSNKIQTLQQQNRVPAGRGNVSNKNATNNYLSPAKQTAKNQRNAALTSQLKNYQNISSKINTGLDKSVNSQNNNNKSYSINQTTQMYSPASKKSNYSIKNTAGSNASKNFSNVVSPSNSNSTRKGANSNNQSHNNLNGYQKQYSLNIQQQNRSLSNKRTQNNPNSARTLPGRQNNQEIKPTIRQNKVNRSEDYSQRQFLNNTANNYYNNNNNQGNGYQDNYYYDQQRNGQYDDDQQLQQF